MKVVSIMNGHNSTVGLFEDGKCVCVVHEEKFNNKKNYLGFPHEALAYIFTIVKPKDVDYVVFPSYAQLFVGSPQKDAIQKTEVFEKSFIRILFDKLRYYLPMEDLFRIFRQYVVRDRITPGIKRQIEGYFLSKYKIAPGKILYVDHHTCHYLTPFFFYGLKSLNKDILIFTLDGEGDGLCSRVVKYSSRDKSFEEISQSNYSASIGLIYSAVTEFLGMKPNEHEYKVMGLAAYVTEEKYYRPAYEKLKKIIWLDKKSLSFKSKFNADLTLNYLRNNLVGCRFDNLAAALQKLTEDLILEWVSETINRTGVRIIAMSGGVFMNVKANQKISELACVDKVFFQPTSSDESLVLGAAAKVFMDHDIELKRVGSMFFGLEYSNAQVKKFLESKGYLKKYKITHIKEIEKKVAELLSDFKVVAYFRGKGEWGARSLCNRCIFGNARDLKTFYEVNDMVKMRDFWMPFAPTILEEWAGKYIEKWDTLKGKVLESSKYMIITFNSTPLAREHLRASIHQKDWTLRPQLVSEKDSGHLYKILKHYEKLTGMGGLMNTSLNMHGYPLVGSLEQAMFTFENSGLKYLVLENYLIEKCAP